MMFKRYQNLVWRYYLIIIDHKRSWFELSPTRKINETLTRIRSFLEKRLLEILKQYLKQYVATVFTGLHT